MKYFNIISLTILIAFITQTTILGMSRYKKPADETTFLLQGDEKSYQVDESQNFLDAVRKNTSSEISTYLNDPEFVKRTPFKTFRAAEEIAMKKKKNDLVEHLRNIQRIKIIYPDQFGAAY